MNFVSCDAKKKNVTPFNVVEMKTDVTQQIKTRHAKPCCDLLQNNSLQFFIASISVLC